jgi:hypothetical protein
MATAFVAATVRALMALQGTGRAHAGLAGRYPQSCARNARALGTGTAARTYAMRAVGTGNVAPVGPVTEAARAIPNTAARTATSGARLRHLARLAAMAHAWPASVPASGTSLLTKTGFVLCVYPTTMEQTVASCATTRRPAKCAKTTEHVVTARRETVRAPARSVLLDGIVS